MDSIPIPSPRAVLLELLAGILSQLESLLDDMSEGDRQSARGRLLQHVLADAECAEKVVMLADEFLRTDGPPCLPAAESDGNDGQMAVLLQRVEVQEAALQFYADPQNYEPCQETLPPFSQTDQSRIERDRGRRALVALMEMTT